MTTVNWPGISGKIYASELCQFGKPFTSLPGVYIFCKSGANNSWHDIYVGECEDFNIRLNTDLAAHHRLDCIKREGATNVCVIRVNGGKTSRLAVETDLRQRLNSPCNRQ
jgi:hypothetical protein